MWAADEYEPGRPPKYGRLPARPPGVSPKWRLAAVGLGVLLVILGILPLALARHVTVVQFREESHPFEARGGPGIQNITQIAPGTFCPSLNPLGPVRLSIDWGVTPAVPLVKVQIWTALPTNAPPGWETYVLYSATNATSGSATLNELLACSHTCNLDDNSTVPVLVSGTATLAYNYTTTEITYPFV